MFRLSMKVQKDSARFWCLNLVFTDCVGYGGKQQAKDMEVGPEEIKAVLLLTAGCGNVGGMHPSLMH